jgi:hypothetical protein
MTRAVADTIGNAAEKVADAISQKLDRWVVLAPSGCHARSHEQRYVKA